MNLQRWGEDGNRRCGDGDMNDGDRVAIETRGYGDGVVMGFG